MYNLLRTASAKHRTVLYAKTQLEGHVAFEGNVPAVKASEQSRLTMAKDEELYTFLQVCWLRAIFLQEISEPLCMTQTSPCLPRQFPSHIIAMSTFDYCLVWARQNGRWPTQAPMRTLDSSMRLESQGSAKAIECIPSMLW